MDKTPKLKDRRSRGLGPVGIVSIVILSLVVICSILAPVLSPYDPMQQDSTSVFAAPSSAHLFGTDKFGRDVLSRILYGGRVSLLISFSAVGIAGVLGLLIGVPAGYFGGALDIVVMRVMESVSVIPYILIAVLAAAANGFKAKGTAVAIGISLLPEFAIWSRSLVLNIHGSGFLLTERAFGIKNAVIIFRHVIPNIIVQYMVKFTSAFSEAVLAATALGYLGYAVQPPHPEWGDMLAIGYNSIMNGRWWLMLFPGFMIIITIISVNLLGNDLSRIITGHTRREGGGK